MKHEKLTEEVIKAFYKVYNTLGYGFLEKVYENAMLWELTASGLKVERQKHISVYYEDIIVGAYCSDMIIEDVLMCELKANECLNTANEAQLINYLKATNIEIGLLMNFGKKPEIKRKIFDNDRK